MQSLEDELDVRRGRSGPQRRRIPPMMRHALGWVPVVLLIAVTLPRALEWDTLAPLPPLLTLHPYVPLLAVPALLIAVLVRLPAAAVVIAGLLMLYGVWLIPRWTAEPRLPVASG